MSCDRKKNNTGEKVQEKFRTSFIREEKRRNKNISLKGSIIRSEENTKKGSCPWLISPHGHYGGREEGKQTKNEKKGRVSNGPRAF
jgi:hypothetical protein